MTAQVAPAAPPSNVWTRGHLVSLVSAKMKDIRFIAVSNREPYVHRNSDKGVACIQPASGLATALDPVMRACGGVWVAHGSGDADREVSDARGHIKVPPRSPSYTLRRIWLDEKLVDEYYYGLANEGLWPLCHVAFHRPRFSQRNWESYRRVNRIFADAVLEEAAGEPAFVFVQDYHLGLLPRMLKNDAPNLLIGQFWHIPWPNPETLRVFPWKEELLDGMLGNDLLGFHLRYHCANFLAAVERDVEAKVNHPHGEITRGGRSTMVRPFPISIDFEWHNETSQSPEVRAEMRRWSDRLGARPEFLGIGIDRVDYTKGIPERLRAFDLFLENYPRYRGRVCFAQVGVPSREQIEDYRDLNAEIEMEVSRLNEKWGAGPYRPVHFFRGEFSQTQLIGLHRLADFCMVSPLHDGLNLVAKEFPASRSDEKGVLILSRFAGAAEELSDALLVNPFSIDEMAAAIHRAISMPRAESRRRMRRLRAAVAENTVYRWAAKILTTLLKMDSSDLPESGIGIACGLGDGLCMLMERLHERMEGLNERMEEAAHELACAPRLLLGLDFDGTLAPIVSDPAVARIPDETGQILDALAARPGTTVAVISGRAMTDLLTRITQNVILGGNHGLEMLANGILWRHTRAADLEILLRTISRQLAVETRGIPGARVEYKGLTASVHYRNVADHQVPGLLEKIRVAIAPYDDCFFLTNGSKVVEVRPAVAWNKGSAMLRILESMRREDDGEIQVCYIGDDATDESVFHTLTDAVTVRVCQDCRTAARFQVRDTDEVRAFLDRILRG